MLNLLLFLSLRPRYFMGFIFPSFLNGFSISCEGNCFHIDICMLALFRCQSTLLSFGDETCGLFCFLFYMHPSSFLCDYLVNISFYSFEKRHGISKIFFTGRDEFAIRFTFFDLIIVLKGLTLPILARYETVSRPMMLW